jgi:hypothetical protein
MRVSNDTFWSIGFKIFGALLLLFMASCGTGNVSAFDVEDQDSFLPLSSRFTNLSAPVCRDSFSAQVASVLVKQGETMDVAKAMSAEALDNLPRRPIGPFFTFSPAGIRYGFLVQNTDFGCVLRLYQRQRKLRGKASVGVTDTLEYLDTRTVLYCSCGENRDWRGPEA